MDFDFSNFDKRASKDFIEEQLKDLESFIELIERTYQVVLIGDREDMNKARKDWKNSTQVEVICMVAYWKKCIRERYH